MSNDSAYNDKVEAIRALFAVCLEQAMPYFDRAVEVQTAYEHGPDSSQGSDVSFPLLFQLIETALPTIWSGVFPRQNFIQAIGKRPMNYEDRFTLERYAENQIEHSGIRQRGLLTLRDCLKFGRGYGSIEVVDTIISKEVTSILVGERGIEAGEVHDVDIVHRVPKYKFHPYCFVVPTTETDNIDELSGLFVFSPVTETQLRAMYAADEALPKEQRSLKLNAATVLKKTEDERYNAMGRSLFGLYAQMAGNHNAVRRMEKVSEAMRSAYSFKGKPHVVVVPVLKCKFANEEIWIANGDQIIYEHKGDKPIRKDFVSVSLFPDSENWWTHGIGSRSLDLDAANNIMFRMILDIAARFGDPVKVLNSTLLENAPDDVLPGDVLKARMMGASQRAIDYVTGPDIPQSMMAMGQFIINEGGKTAGINPQALGQGSPGVMRAGSAGFESWLATTTGREKLMEAVARDSWLLPSIQLIMLHSRLAMGVKEEFQVYDVKKGEYVAKTITKEMFNAVQEWRFNLDAKFDLSPQEKGLRLSQYVQIIKGNPIFDQDAGAAWAFGDEPAVERLIATPEKRQAQEEAMARQAQAMQQAQEQPEPGMESAPTQGQFANA